MKVLKNLSVRNNKKGEGFIFIDENNKIYFLDRHDKSDLSKLTAGAKIIGWVTKDLEKVGYVKLSIDREPISNFINSIPKFDISHFSNFKNKAFIRNSDIVRLSNDMHNKDEEFNTYLSSDSKLIKTSIVLEDVLNDLPINSEIDEFVVELASLYKYLINKFE